MANNEKKSTTIWQRFGHDRKIEFVILALGLIALFGAFSGANEPVIPILRNTFVEPILHWLHSGNSIFFNLSVGYLASFAFWVIVVYVPERNRRILLKENLRRRYLEFRESTIQILLQCANDSADSRLIEKLCDPKAFRDYFDANDKEKWYAALNGMEAEQVKDIQLELTLLAKEVDYILNNLSIQEPKIHAFLKRLNEYIFRLGNNTVYSYDQVKYLGNFLWEIHAWWSIVDGQRDNDVIAETISRI